MFRVSTVNGTDATAPGLGVTKRLNRHPHLTGKSFDDFVGLHHGRIVDHFRRKV